jgi:hypothetical protein
MCFKSTRGKLLLLWPTALAQLQKLIPGAAEVCEVRIVIVGFNWFSAAKKFRIKFFPKLDKLVADM